MKLDPLQNASVRLQLRSRQMGQGLHDFMKNSSNNNKRGIMSQCECVNIFIPFQLLDSLLKEFMHSGRM